MKTINIWKGIVPTLFALAWLSIGASAWGQGSQVLAEVGVVGGNSQGDGVVRPEFDSMMGEYTDWVPPATSRDFRGFSISPRGTALVLDGNFLREFNIAGVPKGDRGFPVDCTSTRLEFNRPKNNGRPNFQTLSECTTFTVLNDGSLRVAGEAQGGGFVIIKAVYDGTWTATLVADGTPPSISDMDGDEFEDADTRNGAGYWAVGDRKKVLWFPTIPEDPDDFDIVATLNGKRIDSVTPGDANRVFVVLDSGEILSINASTGATTAELGAILESAETCGLGRKDPQRYSLRFDPTGDGLLYAGNRGCANITLFEIHQTTGRLQEIDESTNEQLADNPFELDESVATSTMDSFLVETLDYQAGEGGDFTVDCGDPLVLNDPESGCQYGAVEGQAIMFEVKIAEGVNFDTTYRMFQFVDLVDCRWSGDLPCPILNPTASKEEQVLNLTDLLLQADETGVFEQLAFGDEDPPIMAIPPYMRGEATYPDSSGNEVPNGYKFVSFFAVTDAIFLKTFFVDYQIDLFRPDGSSDPCLIPPSGSLIPAINETANLIVYNSGDGFGTVDRSADLDNQGDVQGTRGGVIGNSFCNGGASRARWSANTIGLEFHEDDNPRLYVEQVERMALELQQVRDTLICLPFDNAEYDPTDPNDSPTLGPLLLGSDCSTLQSNLNQVANKLAVCIESVESTPQGNSTENCNAFFTKINNLRSAADAAAWPLPASVANLDLLRPNYEGEFLARIDALEFFVESYLLNSVPQGGIPQATP